MLVAQALVGGLLAISPENLPRVAEVRIDWNVALFTLLISLAASLLFGLLNQPPAQLSEPVCRFVDLLRLSLLLLLGTSICALTRTRKRS